MAVPEEYTSCGWPEKTVISPFTVDRVSWEIMLTAHRPEVAGGTCRTQITSVQLERSGTHPGADPSASGVGTKRTLLAVGSKGLNPAPWMVTTLPWRQPRLLQPVTVPWTCGGLAAVTASPTAPSAPHCWMATRSVRCSGPGGATRWHRIWDGATETGTHRARGPSPVRSTATCPKSSPKLDPRRVTACPARQASIPKSGGLVRW
mmetsp:Transcript_72261/g.127324  ORF Transcript_72261/g.127324 Transcript_72261/m.127324 type:complete len:205 (-) Transcript_72261:627-1241(-)